MSKSASGPAGIVNVIVDNPSWVLPWASQVVAGAAERGFDSALVRRHEDIRPGGTTFFLGCIRLAPPTVLSLSARNLVVHASDLPRGRGFSPLSWLILAGESVVPVCLLEAGEGADTGDVIFRDEIRFDGHELVGEMRDKLGIMSRDLCIRFLETKPAPIGTPQTGAPTYYGRRRSEDSRLDPEKTIAEQFDLLRIVDNESYPAHFDYRGHRYFLKIEKQRSQARD